VSAPAAQSFSVSSSGGATLPASAFSQACPKRSTSPRWSMARYIKEKPPEERPGGGIALQLVRRMISG
jgi:hypothetical protein